MLMEGIGVAGSFEIEVGALRAALRDVVGVVEGRSTVPLLSCVVLRAEPGALTITGTDLDVWLERRVAVDVTTPFAAALEAAVLARIAAKLPADATLLLTLKDGKATLSAGRSRFSLSTLPVDDFPSVPERRWSTEFEIPALTLNAAIDRVSHAMSTDETRYYLGGFLLHAPDSGDLRLVATDGHRLARAIIDKPDGADMPNTIVSRKVAKLLSELLDRHEGTIDVRMHDPVLRFEVGETTLTAKSIDGSFPDYTRVIPSPPGTKAVIDREALTTAIARVITVSSDKTKAVKLVLEADVLTLSVTSPEHGTAVEELPCDWPGEQLTIGFNSHFLLDTLRQLTLDTVDAHFTSGDAPTLWRDREGSGSVFVLMPMRV